MKLKNYILLECKLIIDTSKGCKFMCDVNGEYIFKENLVWCKKIDSDVMYEIDGMRKTSDNILDLVEVGDLVKHNRHMVSGIYEFQKYENNKVYAKRLNNGHGVQGNNLEAIYKLLPNGDYKKYEVR